MEAVRFPSGADSRIRQGGCGAERLYGEQVPRPAEKRGRQSGAGQGRADGESQSGNGGHEGDTGGGREVAVPPVRGAYEVKFQSEGTGSAVHVYDSNGDEILTYTAGVGWHEKESKAETHVHGALKAAYYDAFRTARQEINPGAAGMEMQGCFDARA